MRCDACGRTNQGADDRGGGDDDDEEEHELDLERCDDCGWLVCESCSSDNHRGPCRCQPAWSNSSSWQRQRAGQITNDGPEGQK